jgi:hypothetical protein
MCGEQEILMINTTSVRLHNMTICLSLPRIITRTFHDSISHLCYHHIHQHKTETTKRTPFLVLYQSPEKNIPKRTGSGKPSIP